jgi:hypothetical protein
VPINDNGDIDADKHNNKKINNHSNNSVDLAAAEFIRGLSRYSEARRLARGEAGIRASRRSVELSFVSGRRGRCRLANVRRRPGQRHGAAKAYVNHDIPRNGWLADRQVYTRCAASNPDDAMRPSIGG